MRQGRRYGLSASPISCSTKFLKTPFFGSVNDSRGIGRRHITLEHTVVDLLDWVRC
jgi:hypothetical protein